MLGAARYRPGKEAHMTNFRRYYVPDSIVFITQVIYDRTPICGKDQHLQLLLSTLREVKRLHPFSMLAYVFLLDHFHLLIRPAGDCTFSAVMHSLKSNFTHAYKQSLGITGAMHFWQRRFWDHLIRSEEDFGRHLDYIHYNPVKHGLVPKPEQWAHSSFLQWKERGIYEDEWGWKAPEWLAENDWRHAD